MISKPRRSTSTERDQDDTKGDSDRSDEIEHTRRDEVLGDPDKAGRREDADTADSDDTKADHEGKVFHNVLFALPGNTPKVSITVTCSPALHPGFRPTGRSDFYLDP